MSDFLRHLAARALGLADGVRPRVAALYAPCDADALPDEAGGGMEADLGSGNGAYGGLARNDAHRGGAQGGQHSAHGNSDAPEPGHASAASTRTPGDAERRADSGHDALAEADIGASSHDTHDAHNADERRRSALHAADRRAAVPPARPAEAARGEGFPSVVNLGTAAVPASAGQARPAAGPAHTHLPAVPSLPTRALDTLASTATVAPARLPPAMLAPATQRSASPPDPDSGQAAGSEAPPAASRDSIASMHRPAQVVIEGDGSRPARAGAYLPAWNTFETRHAPGSTATADAGQPSNSRHLSERHPILAPAPALPRAAKTAASGDPYPADQLLPHIDSGPVINVTIGRVEVRAVQPPAPAASTPARPAVRAPSALDSYLHRRKRREAT